jgi:hypothetical protein
MHERSLGGQSREEARVRLGRRFLAEVKQIVSPGTADREKILAACLEVGASFRIDPADAALFQGAVADQFRGRIAPLYADILAAKLRGYSRPVRIISLGCGENGHIERGLDCLLRLQSIVVERWIGIDPYASWHSDSFFAEANFYGKGVVTNLRFADIVDVGEGVEGVLIANYAVHHMREPLELILQRAQGLRLVILLEEPVPTPAKNLVEIVAYDVLANLVLNPNWMRQVVDDPSLFVTNYLEYATIRRCGLSRYPLPHSLPPTELLLKRLR